MPFRHLSRNRRPQVPKPTHAAIAAALADPESFGTTLLFAALCAYGSDLITEEWLPETLVAEIKDDFNIELGPIQAGKLVAALSVFTSNRFFADARDFIDLANALNGSGYDPKVFDPVDCLEAAWAITEAVLIVNLCLEPDDRDPEQDDLDSEIVDYIAQALEDEGIINPPDVLRIVAHDPDRLAKVVGPYSADPDLLGMIVETELAKGENITAEVKSRLDLLFQQLSDLFGTPAEDLIKSLGL